jgi:transcription initiation factor TFIID TATA-box-binding protein
MTCTLSIIQVRPLAKHEAYINIENVVATATLNQKIDLNSIVRIVPGVEYRPEQFPGLVYRLKKPKTATLIFSSGKMVCTGAKSERLARKAVTKVVDELKRNGLVILAKPEIQVQNIVASAGLGGKIDLEKTTYSLKSTMYEPEQFPGLIYRMDDPKVVILIFTTEASVYRRQERGGSAQGHRKTAGNARTERTHNLPVIPSPLRRLNTAQMEDVTRRSAECH